MIVLKPVDRVEVLSVMDNSIDVLMGNTPLRGGRSVRGIRSHGHSFGLNTAFPCS